MHLTSWLDSVRVRLGYLTNRRITRRSLRRPMRPSAVTERLEDRTLLSVTSLWLDGELSVRSDSGDTIAIESDSVLEVVVRVNGVEDTSLPPIAAADVQSIVVEGGDLANELDLRAVVATAFTYTDPITGDPMSIRVDGHNGNDTIFGSPGFGDIISGGDGDDFIDGREGDDSIAGNDGADEIFGNTGDDTVEGGDGTDLLFGLDGDDQIDGGDGSDTISGGTGSDVITGGDHADLITGNEGDDTINGESGTDTLRGDAGDDSIRGGGAADLIEGGDGNDNLNGQGADDSIDGGNGNDSLIGGGGRDTLVGNDGDDRISGSGGNDMLEGADGDDSLYGGSGSDVLYGDSSDVSVTGDGNDKLKGQGGNDTLYGGGGADYLEGGSGNDLIDSFLPQLTLILIDDPVVGAEGDAASLTVFSNGFEGSVPSEFSGFTSTTSVQGFAGIGTNSNVFAGDFLRNDSGCCGALPTTAPVATRLTLTDLPAHESVDVDFLLAIINSWNDANDSSIWGPDHFVVTVDGTEIFNENFRNIDGSTQGYQPPAGVALTPTPLGDLGFPAFPLGALENNDSAYNMGLDPTFDAIPHTADTLTVEWYAGGAGWEGGANESWGIDNVEVTLNEVPVESTATFNVTLSHSSNDTISVDYTTVDDTAQAGSDYETISGTVTFDPGSTHETISVTVLGDTVAEGDETFEVALYSPINAAIGDPQGVATITDDDAAGSLALANNFLADRADEIGIDVADLDDARVTDQYVSRGSGTSHIYLQQTHAGLDVQGATIGIHVSAKDELVALNSEFVQGLGSITPAAEDVQPQLNATEALEQVADQLGWMVGPGSIITLEGPNDNPNQEPAVDQAQVLRSFDISPETIPVHLAWVPTDDGGIDLVWNMTIERAEGPHLFDITASATSGDILSQTDLVHNYSYEVFAQPVANPNDAARSLEVDPQDAVSSPSGWHDDGTSVYTDTRGNNAIVQEDANSDNAGGTRPDGGASGVFAFPLDLTQAPSANEDAANTNMFYWANIVHDIYYRYGFDEAAGNFQATNFTGQGTGGDALIVDILDPTGGLPGSPNIIVPADGSSPRITLGPNTGPDPDTMGSLSNEIFVHEYGHGVTKRLIGGPSNVSVLTNSQGAGMGEGWSDWQALMLHQKATDTPTTEEVNGDYFLQNPAGVRRFPYTTDMTVNALTYESYNASSQMHDAGEIWASVLWDLNWQMIARCDFDGDLQAGSGGNTTLLQLTMDSMKLSPTDPTFLQARDAILQADVVMTGGENAFDIWTAFARRGMGFSADDGASNNDTVVDGFDLPPGVVDPGTTHSCADAPPGPGPGPGPEPSTPQDPDYIGDTLIGNSGQDTLRGALGDDLLNGGGGNDLLEGSGGDDLMYGGSSRDTLSGGSGNDTLNGQGGVDTIDGNDDDDTMIWQVGTSSDNFSGTEGFDELIVQGDSANNRLTVSESTVGNIQISDNTYVITAAQSVTRITIDAGSGNDRITIQDVHGSGGVLLVVNGQNGGDTITAAGADLGSVRLLAQGGDGNDTITGSTADDLLRGEDGNDLIDGGAGDDTIDGGANHDSLAGGAGDDLITGGIDNDTIAGGDGNDTLRGQDGHDNLIGDAGDDSLYGNDGNDTLNGSAGDDLLEGADGRDTLRGGNGDDTLDGGVDDDVLYGQGGNDVIAGRDGDDQIDGASGDDLINGGDGHDMIEGGTGNDTLAGSDGNDRINAGSGKDVVVGGDGHDTLLGGGGSDTALGGDGDDFINGNGSTDVVAGNEGDDVLTSNLASEIDEAFQLSNSILDLLDQV